MFAHTANAEHGAGMGSEEALASPVTLVVSRAPVKIFLTALFGNTALSLEVHGEYANTVSGEYVGTVNSVLQTVSTSHDFRVEVVDGLVVVQPKATANPITDPAETESVDSSQHAVLSLPNTIEDSHNSSTAPTQISRVVNNDTTLSKTASEFELDPVVERVFTLQYASVQDTHSEKTGQPIIPGVASELRRLVEQLGIEALHPSSHNKPRDRVTSQNIMAIPAVNAIVVTDYESRMALYADLIESIDSAYVMANRAKANQQDKGQTTAPSTRNWTVVQ